MNGQVHQNETYAGIVWILSGVSLFLYGVLTLVNQNVPGVEQLVDYLSTVHGAYIYGAAFLSILIEGLYIIGSFFPGSTLVVLLSVFSQTGGIFPFLITMFFIFLGWCMAGVINILFTRFYQTRFLLETSNTDYVVKDRPWTTWFPAFRANYEVAQVTEGGDPYKVFWSSVKVKFLVSLLLTGCIALLPLIIDISEVGDEEGAVSVFVIAGISLLVGVIKLRRGRL